MSTAVDTLFDRAERAGAALMVYDDQERIVKVNDKHAKLYEFTNFATRPSFEQLQRSFLETGRAALPEIYKDAQAWLNASACFRKTCDSAQFVVRHANDRVILVCHERIRGATDWCYQARIDITRELKARINTGKTSLDFAYWDTGLTPLTRNTTVPIGNVLEAMPTAAGLILARGKLIDANRMLLALLNDCDGLHRIDDRVVPQETLERQEFKFRLQRFFQSGGQTPVAMRITRQGCAEPYFLTVTPLLDPERETWDNGHIGILTVANPATPPAIAPSLLKEFFDITLAEAEVAAALGTGQSIDAIAKQRGVKTNTVYAQVKKIIERTGYRNQADIARRVSDLARIFGRRQ